MSRAVEQVKERIDLVEYISRYLSLKRSGTNYKGLSPFNQEKTPSFVVTPDKGIWYDFSAGFGGDIFDFVMKLEGMDFYQALKHLADLTGVELEPRPEDKKNQVDKRLLYQLNDLAKNFYQHRLLKSPEALEYLKGRGFKRQAIIDFGIGYAPASGQELYTFLINKGYQEHNLVLAGLVGRGQRGAYDFFRDRITLPINDFQGRVIGFSARLLKPKEGVGKYINTANSPIYQKSEAVYGITQARENIRSNDQVIVVEGNLDVISLNQAGVKYVVAGSGTAVGRGQIKILARYSSNITLCFDGDRAGRQATDKLIKAIFDLDLNLKLIFMPAGQDPDSLITEGLEAWQKVADQVVSLSDYLLINKAKDFDLTRVRSRLEYLREIFSFLVYSKSQAEVESYIEALAKRTRLPRASIRQDFNQYRVSNRSTEANSSGSVVIPEIPKTNALEEDLLAFILVYPEIYQDFRSLDYSKLLIDQDRFEQIITQDLSKADKSVNLLVLKAQERFANLPMQDAFSQYQSIVAKLRDQWYDRELAEIRSQLNQAELGGDQPTSRNLIENYQKLLKERNERRKSRA